MLYFFCIFVNILAIASFLKRKWKTAALAYSVSLFVFTLMALFSMGIPETDVILKRIFGTSAFEYISYAVNSYTYWALAPYLAVELISLFYAIFVSITIAKNIAKIVCNNSSLYSSNTSHCDLVIEDNNKIKDNSQKRYLLFCSFLC